MSRKWMALCIALSLVRISFAFEPTEPGKGENGDDRGVFPEQKQNNLISNPGFENKTSRWVLGKINGGAGQFTTDTISSISGERSARVTTRNHNKEYKDLSLFTFLPLENGTNYTFSFQASAQTGCLISVSFDNGDQSYFTEEIWLEPRLKTYGPFSFTAIDDDIFNRLCFNLGKSNTVIQLDDVRVNATHIEEELPEKLSASGVNLEYLQDSEYNSILVSVPVKPAQDIPILIYDENDNVIYANKLTKRSHEAVISLKRKQHIGNYRLDVYLASKKESIDLFLK